MDTWTTQNWPLFPPKLRFGGRNIWHIWAEMLLLWTTPAHHLTLLPLPKQLHVCSSRCGQLAWNCGACYTPQNAELSGSCAAAAFYGGRWENMRKHCAVRSQRLRTTCPYDRLQTTRSLRSRTPPIAFCGGTKPALVALACHVSHPATTSAPAAAWKSKEKEMCAHEAGAGRRRKYQKFRGEPGGDTCVAVGQTGPLSSLAARCLSAWNTTGDHQRGTVSVFGLVYWQKPDALFHFRWRRIIIWSQSLCGRILKMWNYDGWDYMWGEKKYLSLLVWGWILYFILTICSVKVNYIGHEIGTRIPFCFACDDGH